MVKKEKSAKRNILFCGGGTAGHIYPAIAIIEEIRENYPGTGIWFIGTDSGMEKKLIPETGVKFLTIKASGFNKYNNIIKRISGYLRFIINTISGFFSSVRIIRRFDPDFILGMGGYVCGPVLLAGKFMGKDIALHEQNYIPGRSNRLFSRFSRYIFVSFEGTEKYMDPKKIIFSGNPVRKFIFKQKDNIDDLYNKWGIKKGVFTVTAFGGSLGAEKINNCFLSLYERFRDKSDIQFILISGRRFYEDPEIKKYLEGEDSKRIRIFPYISEMDEIYKISDLVISRAGANTIAELVSMNIPAILIPFPNAINNHQYYNAKYLMESGKAILLEDRDLTPENLDLNIGKIINKNNLLYKKMLDKKVKNNNIKSSKIIADVLLRGSK